jgi:hypothetical protein
VSNAIEARLPSSSAGLRRVDLGRPEFGTMARADGSVRRFSLIAVIPARPDLRGPSAITGGRTESDAIRIGCGRIGCGQSPDPTMTLHEENLGDRRDAARPARWRPVTAADPVAAGSGRPRPGRT